VSAEPQRVRYTGFGKCYSEAEVIGERFMGSRCCRVGASRGLDAPHRLAVASLNFEERPPKNLLFYEA
jgi:hypothetical protein